MAYIFQWIFIVCMGRQLLISLQNTRKISQIATKMSANRQSLAYWLLLICIVSTATCINFQLFNNDKAHWVAHVADNIHRFVIPNEQYIKPQYAHLHETLPTGPNIEYYYYVCGQKPRDIIRTCDPSRKGYLLLGYNKGTAEFEAHLKGLTQMQEFQMLTNKIREVVKAEYKVNTGQAQIIRILNQKNQLMIVVENSTIKQYDLGTKILAKQFPFMDFIYISDPGIMSKYQFEQGDVYFIKTISNDQKFSEGQGQLLDIIRNQKLTHMLNRDVQRKYDIMKLYTLENLYTRGFSKDAVSIQGNRFDLKVRKKNPEGIYQQQRSVIIYCDLTQRCLKYWHKLDNQLIGFNNTQNVACKRVFYRADTVKNLQITEIFYHIKVIQQNPPFVLVLDGQDPNNQYLPVRYTKQLKIDSENPLQQIQSYLKDIDQGRVEKFKLISSKPKKNGFTGKGSQRFIQKLNFETYKQAISAIRQDQSYYFLFVTATEFQCPQCTQFYNQLKKLASYLNSGEEMKVRIGLYDLSKDQIDLLYLRSIPSVFMFNPYTDDPLEYEGRYDFDHVRSYLKKKIDEFRYYFAPKPPENQENKVSEQL